MGLADGNTRVGVPARLAPRVEDRNAPHLPSSDVAPGTRRVDRKAWHDLGAGVLSESAYGDRGHGASASSRRSCWPNARA